MEHTRFTYRDSSFLDVCSNEDLPEVELVNLLEEQLPQYKLRVDSLFLYENQDWAQSSHQQQDAPETLSPVLAEETFRYMSEFVLFVCCFQPVQSLFMKLKMRGILAF